MVVGCPDVMCRDCLPGCPHGLRQFWCDAKAVEQQMIERLKELFTQSVWYDFFRSACGRCGTVAVLCEATPWASWPAVC